MIKFKISAPGRIILSGDHTVTFGNHFVVAGLDLRTNLEFCELSDEQTNIRIEFQDYEKDVPLQEVQCLSSRLIRENLFSDQVNLLKEVNSFINVNNMWEKTEQKVSLLMLFFLLCTVTYKEHLVIKPFRLHVSTEIPFENGLGGSTSFVVCLAACFLHWKRLQSGVYIRFNEQDLEKIEEYNRSCEGILQKDALATIDAKVCVYGRINKCKHIHSNVYDMKCIDVVKTGIKILLIGTHLYLTEAQRYKQIADLMLSRSNFNSIFNELDKIAINIFDDLNYINNNIENSDAYNDLQRDIKKNQQMLSKYDLSYFEFDIVSCLGSGFNLAGKLTGFKGSYVYFPLPPKITKEEITYYKSFLV
ncbi:mevalonate kinase-like isoform X1 [Nylanderia fulva]|uniref:mevalonate kinase-like isoform X1 n=1 Tax=Nylanderia fulva TaxID=613905 RepID=UPI0010FB03B8|nr:mevalonate kinase-like isoform X1 [Nylanderia fulva]